MIPTMIPSMIPGFGHEAFGRSAEVPGGRGLQTRPKTHGKIGKLNGFIKPSLKTVYNMYIDDV